MRPWACSPHIAPRMLPSVASQLESTIGLSRSLSIGYQVGHPLRFTSSLTTARWARPSTKARCALHCMQLDGPCVTKVLHLTFKFGLSLSFKYLRTQWFVSHFRLLGKAQRIERLSPRNQILRPVHLFVPAELVNHCELRLLWKLCEY